MKLKIMVLLITINLASCTNKNKPCFQMLLIFEPNKDTIIAYNESAIVKIDWKNQKYFFKVDSLNKIKHLPIGNPAFQFAFVFNSQEIYRAAMFSKSSSAMPEADIAIIKPEGIGGIFEDNVIQVSRLDKATINKNLFNKTEKYLRKQNLLIE